MTEAQKARLARLKSYQRLSQPLQGAVKLHLTYGVPGIEALTIVGQTNQGRTWESAKVQRVLADFAGDIDGILADLDAPTSPAPAPQPRIFAPSSPVKAPVAAAPPILTPEPALQPCSCGKPSSGNMNGNPACPVCMIAACGIKPDGTPLPAPLPPPAPAPLVPLKWDDLCRPDPLVFAGPTIPTGAVTEQLFGTFKPEPTEQEAKAALIEPYLAAQHAAAELAADQEAFDSYPAREAAHREARAAAYDPYRID